MNSSMGSISASKSRYSLKRDFTGEIQQETLKGLKNEPEYSIIGSDYKVNLKYCIIRQDKSLNMKARAETPWDVKIGVFKDYLREERR